MSASSSLPEIQLPAFLNQFYTLEKPDRINWIAQAASSEIVELFTHTLDQNNPLKISKVHIHALRRILHLRNELNPDQINTIQRY
jgi:hypothetical protein